ncbi:4a-hydroxytetrahydrobiopterin dehydratase [Candidatus Poriferisodalis sp.]|uniref:4a-hydroxytetrahydrobiopterin dehydratase n=1 Tax=Candidatus Poriferisodalis sp. TaxID=3101277 RepID=UPI003B01B902
MTRELLSEDELAALTSELESWQVSGSELRRTFRFASFVEAFSFMTAAALAAEKMDHHPNWSNVYSTVEVALSTHDRGGVTELDAALARAMDAWAGHSSAGNAG